MNLLIRTFVRKALYGCAGSLAYFLLQIGTAPPPADALAANLWALAIVPLVTGLAAVITKAANGAK